MGPCQGAGDSARRFRKAERAGFARISQNLLDFGYFVTYSLKTTGFSLLAEMDQMYSVHVIERRDAPR
jgi:hypothetical protein